MKFAHFSDFHLGRSEISVRLQRRYLSEVVDHALERGADHLLFSGDIVDHGNLEDAQLLVEVLTKRGLYHPDGFSIVPGNHDIWPFGESDLFRDGAAWAFGNLKAFVTGDALPAQERYEAFADLFWPAFEGTESPCPTDPFPRVKTVGTGQEKTTIVMLDTTSNKGGLHAVKGRFERSEGQWVEWMLARSRASRSLLLMHHWPWAFRFDVEGILENKPWAIRKLAEGAQVLGTDLNGLVEPGFPNHVQVRNFIERVGFDAVLCGHIHLFDGDPRDSDFEEKIGKIPVHCMGRSGGVHQGHRPVLAYHTIEVGGRRCSVETEYIET